MSNEVSDRVNNACYCYSVGKISLKSFSDAVCTTTNKFARYVRILYVHYIDIMHSRKLDTSGIEKF